MRSRLFGATGRCVLIAGLLTLFPVAPAYAQQSVAPLPDNSQACLQAPQGTYAAVPWAQQQLAPQRVWPLTQGSGIIVAIVDTGVDAQTPQLADGRVRRGVDVTTPANGPADNDCYGHGTFLAGIIGAAAAVGTGFVGVAPGVTILPIRCATAIATSETQSTSGTLTPASMARGIRQGVDSGAQVINISASTTAQDADLAAAVQYAAAHDVVVVASAGNSSKQGDPVTYPAAYPSVIAVGAVDATGKPADFSQTGPFVSLVAPGVDVVSVGPGGPGQWQGSGTSYSAPFVAGTAALVRAYRPHLTAAQIKHRLEVTADHPAAVLPDPALGWGTVNPMAAVSIELPEEGAARPTVVVGPQVRAPDITPPDELGPLLAVLGVLLVICFAFTLMAVSRLYDAGRRRGWRRARVVEVASPASISKDRSSANSRPTMP